MPTLPQILDGLPPANTGPVRPVQAPGAEFRYSGGGSTIVQLWVEDVSGQSFATQMQKWVLQPLNLLHSQFEPPALADDPRFAMSHQGRTPEPGGARVYPELQAAGLWSTPSDIATAWMAVQRALAGQIGPVSATTARAVTTAVTPLTSIGFFIDGSEGVAQRFGHNGSNQGFESFSTAFVNQGEGVVIMANGQNTWGLVDAVVRTLGRVYGWPGMAAPLAVAAQALPAEAGQWVGNYQRKEGPALQVRQYDGALYLTSGPGSWQRLWRTQTGAYTTEFGRPQLRFSTAGMEAEDGTAPLPRQALVPLRWPAVYLRGSFNNWRAEHPLQEVAEGQWRLHVELAAGRQEFKLGDADWQTINLGSSGSGISLGAWMSLGVRGSNLVADIATGGRYLLELEASDTPSPPRMRLSRMLPPEPKS